MPQPQTALDAWQPQRLRVPRVDGGLLVQPGFDEAVELTRRNASRLDSSSISLQGRTLRQLREWTRREVARVAAEYTAKITGEMPSTEHIAGFVVGGHQPELFHPGVWVKNFAVGELAARTGLAPLNLVIDNDLLARAAIRIPAGTPENPRREWLAFDADHPRQPWEEAGIADPHVLKSLPERAAEAMGHWGIEPLAAGMATTIRDGNKCARLADCITATRVELERAWGLHNLEVPISRVCEIDPFLWFLSHILANLPQFREVYNVALGEFRALNHVRSHTHPVPELKREGDWLEAPFWVWQAGDAQRRRLMARQVDRTIELSNGIETFARLRLAPDMEACCAVEDLRQLPQRGIRLRTRALTTTLFSRLCLADLFVHGIGGAKYDEMTDQIIRRFYGIEPPAFLTVSATLHLPLAGATDVDRADAIRLRALLRDLQFNADRHLTAGADPRIDELVADKRRLIAERQSQPHGETTRSQRRARSRENFLRFRRLHEISQELSQFAAEQRQRVQEELDAVEAQLAANAVLRDRQYAFCLFPEERLRQFVTSVAPSATGTGNAS